MAYARRYHIKNHRVYWTLVTRNKYHRKCHNRHGMLKNSNTWITPSYFLNHLVSTSVIDITSVIVITQFNAPVNGK